MTSRMRKLTAVGLPAREELLVRTLLKVIHAKTTEPWSFHDSLEANVALCNPESALSMMAIKRASSHGLVCVSVVHEGGHGLPETLTLRAPIRSGDFIDMLNEASGRLQLSGRMRRVVPPDDGPRPSLAMALRDWSAQTDASCLRADVGGRTWVISLKTRRLGGPDALNDEALLALGQSSLFRLEPMDDAHGEAALATASWVGGLDRLWWLSGLHAAPDAMPEATEDRSYQLRRWPDAGRLQLQPSQLRMAALLTRQSMTMGELATMVARPVDEVRSFLSGCAMLGLLSEGTAAPVVPEQAPPAAPRHSRYSDLFQSLRAVLGMRM